MKKISNPILKMNADLIESWKRKDSLNWTPIERLLNMINHFSLGILIATFYQKNGKCCWKMRLSKEARIKVEAEGRYSSLVKYEAAVKLMDYFELGFNSEISQPMEIDEERSLWNPVGLELQALDQYKQFVYLNVYIHSGEFIIDSNILH